MERPRDRLAKKITCLLALLLIGAATLAATPAGATSTHVQIDTSALSGAAVLEFDLINGDAVSGNNTARVTGFAPAGILVSEAGRDPSVTGDLVPASPGVTFADSLFLNSLLMNITLGSVIEFDVDMTENVPPGPVVPDGFSASLDGGVTSLFEIGADGTQAATPGSPPVTLSPVTPVPEPAVLWLVGLAVPLAFRRAARGRYA